MGPPGRAPAPSLADPPSRWQAIQACLQRNDTSEALARAREFTAAFPDHAPAFVAASQAELAVGNPHYAYAAALRAIEQSPRWSAGFAALGGAALELAELGTASVAVTRAVELDPSVAMSHALLGQVQLARGKNNAARRSFGQALRIRPDYPEVRDMLAGLDAMTGAGDRRKAFQHVVDRVASGQMEAAFLTMVVDVAVSRRARWLAIGSSYGGLLCLGMVLGTGADQGYGTSTVGVALVFSSIVLAMCLGWAVPLLRAMPPAARRLLPGLRRRERLLAFGLWGYSIPVLIMLTIPLWWIMDSSVPVKVASAVAAGLPIVTEILVAGIGFELSASGARELLVGALTRPYLLPVVIAVALVAIVIRACIRAVRPVGRTAPAGTIAP